MCKECRECGMPLEGKRQGAVFCSPEHRKAFNNRRMIRGAELYDLIMAQNYERELRKPEALMSVISNLARAFRDSDKVLRNGRKSWDAKETLARLPLAFGTEGDKR
jgi:hypothetical protein